MFLLMNRAINSLPCGHCPERSCQTRYRLAISDAKDLCTLWTEKDLGRIKMFKSPVRRKKWVS